MVDGALTDEQKLRRLPWALGMIAFNAVFAYFTFSGPIFILFLAELGLSKTRVGLILSFLPLTGVVSVLVGPALARLGYKRSFLFFWAARKTIIAALLLTPWALGRWGAGGAGLFVMAVFLGFALCRSIGDTAYFPWTQDFVPDRLRGRFTALDNLLWTGFGFLAVGVASLVIARLSGLDGFMRCIAIGVPFGYAAVACTFMIPGGAPAPRDTSIRPDVHGAWGALRDSSFARFLVGLGLMGLTIFSVSGFLPLYAREVIGLPDDAVVLMQNATLLGGLLSSFFWGWAADRAGSKPVMLAGAGMASLLPLLWLSVPRHQAESFPVVLALALFAGLASPAWAVGSGRILFVELMPPGKRGPYTAVYYAWAGLTGAAGALISGRVLDYAQSLGPGGLVPGLDGYSLVFGACSLLALASLGGLWRIKGRPEQVALSHR